MKEIFDITGKIAGVHSEEINLEESFLTLASRFASLPGTVVLLSGGELDCARYHILAAIPWFKLSGRSREMSVEVFSPGGITASLKLEEDPFNLLQMLLNEFRLDAMDLPEPIAAGFLGYLAYDLKDHLEELPRTSVDDLGLPQMVFYAPSIIVVHDKIDEKTRLFVPDRIKGDQSCMDSYLKEFNKIISSPLPGQRSFSGGATGFRSNFTRPDYMDSIKRVIEYIASGHVYQVNMSQRFEMDFEGHAFALFENLYNLNPAPFFAYINAGDHQIVSTSPERFILRKGRDVETRPIKGTLPRGKTEEEDKELGRRLSASRKDDAELSMIVDLLRNDIGKVCDGGSVRVEEHKRLEAYENVFHLVSIVNGTLADRYDSIDLVKATFPGGSITGCPKIRSMEIIDELEPKRRHIYTGSIGYISFHDTMDLSIAIRTATIYNGRVIFSVGGGIVYDSDPSDEFDETLHKGKTLMEVFKGNNEQSVNSDFVWMNGVVKPAQDAAIPVGSQGFQYGFGFFETIKALNGKTQFLEEHLERFNMTWESLFRNDPPDITWKDIIEQVLTRNCLNDGAAAVKILAAKGEREKPPCDDILLVSARPYIHRLENKEEPGLALVTYPEPRQSPLADHKTLNYLYYLLAGKWAIENSGDEALILNPEGTVSETNTANIMIIKGKRVLLPDSPHVLPGVIENVAKRTLGEWGYEIEKKEIKPEELFSADEVIITNSLIGAVPVISLDGKKLSKPSDLCERLNSLIEQ